MNLKTSAKKDEVIKGLFATTQFRKRFVDSFFKSFSVGDLIKINSSFYPNITAKIIQITEFLIIAQDINKPYIRPVISKFDYFCGACKVDKIKSLNLSLIDNLYSI